MKSSFACRQCDGRRPSCSQCTTRDGPCVYDMTDDQRRLTHLRDNVEQLQEKSSSLEALLAALQAANDHEAMEIYRRIRHGGDLHTLAAQVQAGRLLSGMGSIGGTPPRITAKQSELPKGMFS